jgi:hypothetical protein
VKTDWLRAPDTRTTTDERERSACVHDCFATRLSRPRQRRAAGEARAERLYCRAITMARTHARSDRAARQAAQRPAVCLCTFSLAGSASGFCLWFFIVSASVARRAAGRFNRPALSRRRSARGTRVRDGWSAGSEQRSDARTTGPRRAARPGGERASAATKEHGAGLRVSRHACERVS